MIRFTPQFRRVRDLVLATDVPLTVVEIADALELPQVTVRRALKKLRDERAVVVTCRKRVAADNTPLPSRGPLQYRAA